MNTSRQHGFTLIELMIVIAIIAILAAMATSSYQSNVVRARVSEAFVAGGGYKHLVEENYANTVKCNTNISVWNSTPNVASVAVDETTGTITAVGTAAAGNTTITLTPGTGGSTAPTALACGSAPVDSNITWKCSAAPAKYAPSGCQ